jgi:FKBP-type peptidyl-prolyl cis-trans isomerase FkpA
MKKALSILSILVLFGACSCNRNSSGKLDEPMSMDSIKKQYKEPMMEWNHAKVRDQNQMIIKYAERRNWDMTRTETGLFYDIYFNGEGNFADSGMIAVIHYDLHLLDGRFCYSSDSTGPRNIRLGKSNSESGLEEALLQMRIGDKAHIIIPPFLGFGLPGDGNKVPPDAILVYNVELTDLY